MSKRVFKLFMAWESDKEEKWLNDMSAEGMQLVRVTGQFYTFEQGRVGEYIYRLELLEELPSHKKSAEYISFLEDTGVEYIGSYIRWVYFRKKAIEGSFDLYSDIDSQLKQNSRILLLLPFVVLPLLCITFATWFGHFGSQGDFQNGFTIGVSIVAVPFILVTLLGAGRILRRRRQLLEEKKLRE